MTFSARSDSGRVPPQVLGQLDEPRVQRLARTVEAVVADVCRPFEDLTAQSVRDDVIDEARSPVRRLLLDDLIDDLRVLRQPLRGPHRR